MKLVPLKPPGFSVYVSAPDGVNTTAPPAQIVDELDVKLTVGEVFTFTSTV